MTPEERARKAISNTTQGQDFVQVIAAAIREAVAEEREAIAAITDHWARVHAGVIGEMFARLSEVIRDRT